MSFCHLVNDGGGTLKCPFCGAKLSVKWDTEYGDPLIGDREEKCPACGKYFRFDVEIVYTVLTKTTPKALWCPACQRLVHVDMENMTSMADHGRCQECQKRWQVGELKEQNE